MKKPEPERTQPVRNWWTVFGAPGASQAPGDTVSHGVELGYRVIEEYLRQGQNAASMLGGPPLGGAPLGGTPFEAGAQQQRLGAMLQGFTDFASLWLQWMGMAGGPGAFAARAPGFAQASGQAGPFSTECGPTSPPEAPPPKAPRTAASEAGTSSPVEVTVAIDSRRPTEVTIELRPGASGLPLRILDLRAPELDKPRLTEVEIARAPQGDRVSIRLRIPDGHPPGVYSGIILDEQSGLPRGTLSVRIAPE
jgi:hypothetical protein